MIHKQYYIYMTHTNILFKKTELAAFLGNGPPGPCCSSLVRSRRAAQRTIR